MRKPISPIIQHPYKNVEKQDLKFYCVSCNLERRQSPPARMGSPRFFGHIALTTIFLSILTWPWLHFKGLFAFIVPVGLFFEALFRIKMRASLICPDCSFDPVLYLSDPDKAVRQVKETWQKKFEEKGFSYPSGKKAAVKKEEILT